MASTLLAAALSFPNIDPAIHIGPIAIRWYSLAYIGGIVLGWWYMLRLIDRPGAPMAKRHVDDFILWATLGIILGGRLGYVLFYNFSYYLGHPLDALKVWEGGMSFHGGLLGTTLAIILFTRKRGISLPAFADHVACVVPIGLFLGRIANFINGELFGRPSDVGWAMVFPDGGPWPRHPSQLYEAGLEGLVLFLILAWLFFKTGARAKPGLIAGNFFLFYGLFRFIAEFTREPDPQLGVLSIGITMGQLLSLPMMMFGAGLMIWAWRRPAR
ncbi:MAG: prolipoprotein diacylglyceryl transferase [Sphingomonadales bacterium]